MQLLIVDDDPLCRRIYRAELERGGYTVYEASDGFEALEMLKELTVDLITLDLAMPNMGGFEFCDRLWSRDFASHFHKNTDRRLPILIITASDSIPNRVKSLRGGIADFMTKGFAPGTLLKRVNQILKPTNPFSGLRPLIISSDQGTHAILGNQLQELGLTCTPVAQVSSNSLLPPTPEGISGPVDVVFIDAFHCPEGPEVCHQLRKVLDREELPIIVMLPQGPAEQFLSWITAGATDFLQVPFGQGELKAKLGTALAMVRSSEFPLSPDAQPLPAALYKGMEQEAEEDTQTHTILHNISNVLSSVVVSSSLLRQKTDESQLWKLKMAHQLLGEHVDDLPGFFRHDPRGSKLVPYMLAVGNRLEHEYQQLTHELRDLDTKLQLIQSMVHLRPVAKSLRKAPDFHPLNPLVGAALQVLQGSLQTAAIDVDNQLSNEIEVYVPKNRTIHVFINLIKNALDAMSHMPTKVLTITCRRTLDAVEVCLSDTGKGFDSATQPLLGTLGFTTKLNGQGIGLAFCKKTLGEMGGTLVLESDGLGMGCRTTLTLPTRAKT